MMLAERDREYLKQCRRCCATLTTNLIHSANLRNRDAEAKLMANEEGWEVGTWYGHPIYKVIDHWALIHWAFLVDIVISDHRG